MCLLLRLALFAFGAIQFTLADPPLAGPPSPAPPTSLAKPAPSINADPITIDCVDKKPFEAWIVKSDCRNALNRFLREYGSRSDYIFTREYRYHGQPDYFICPQYFAQGDCVFIIDLPSFQGDVLPIGNVATIVRYANAVIDGCVASAGTNRNGGRVFMASVNDDTEFVGIYVAPNLFEEILQGGEPPHDKTW